MAYLGMNLYSSYVKAMQIFNHIEKTKMTEEEYFRQICDPFFELSADQGWNVYEALTGWVDSPENREDTDIEK